MRSRHVTLLASADHEASSGNDEEARVLLRAETETAVELCRQQVAGLEDMIEDAHAAGFTLGVRVARRYLHAVRETLLRHEQLLAALEAGLSDAELVRVPEANRQAIAEPWACAKRSFNRARARATRVARAPSSYRARSRHLRPTYRRRAQRRAARPSTFVSAGDGAPPPEPDPAERIGLQDARRAGGAS